MVDGESNVLIWCVGAYWLVVEELLAVRLEQLSSVVYKGKSCRLLLTSVEGSLLY